MTLKKRLVMILAIALLAGGLYGTGRLGMTVQRDEEEEAEEEFLFGHRDTLYLWYTDEALTDYLNSVVVSYSEYQDEVRVVPVYTSGLEYLETINQASLQTKEVPDLYIVSNDSLEKAYLAGLASEVRIPQGVLPMAEILPGTAVQAVTYRDKQIGYPFYYETSCFLYNRTYLEDWARAQLEAQRDEEIAQESQEQADNGDVEEEAAGETSVEEISAEAVAAKIEEALPQTIDDILAFADVYDAPEQVEAVFKWDVSDIFYNYFFAGNYMDVGGASGDRSDSIHIYNEEAIRCLRVYQDLNQFFSIDTQEISYEGVLNDFMEGKIVYTVATTDSVAKLEEAKENGTFAYEYSISKVPDINEQLLTRSLSVTNCVVVNGYSDKQELASDFAEFLTCDYTDTLYSRTGKVASRYGVDYGNSNLQQFASEYEVSVPMPKMVETSNFWVELEIAFAQIWDGADANARLKELSEQIMTQITGAPYVETAIEEEAEEEEEVEYLDEDALREEAQGESDTP